MMSSRAIMIRTDVWRAVRSTYDNLVEPAQTVMPTRQRSAETPAPFACLLSRTREAFDEPAPAREALDSRGDGRDRVRNELCVLARPARMLVDDSGTTMNERPIVDPMQVGSS